MKRNLRWSMMDSSTASLTRAVEVRAAPSIIDMKPIASFGPHTSITLSPITISTTPDCTTYMQVPGSPLLKTTLPAGKLTLAPAPLANARMSISPMNPRLRAVRNGPRRHRHMTVINDRSAPQSTTRKCLPSRTVIPPRVRCHTLRPRAEPVEAQSACAARPSTGSGRGRSVQMGGRVEPHAHGYQSALGLDRGLRRGETGHGHAEGRAGDVVETRRVAEGDGGGIAAMLAADADLEAGPRLAAALGAEAHELAHPVPVDGDERVDLEDRPLRVVGEDRRGIVARQPEAGLGEVVGAEREELGACLAGGDLVGLERGARQLDHGADLVFELDARLLLDRRRGGDDHVAQDVELATVGDERDHHLRHHGLAGLAPRAHGRLEDGAGLRLGD